MSRRRMPHARHLGSRPSSCLVPAFGIRKLARGPSAQGCVRHLEPMPRDPVEQGRGSAFRSVGWVRARRPSSSGWKASYSCGSRHRPTLRSMSRTVLPMRRYAPRTLPLSKSPITMRERGARIWSLATSKRRGDQSCPLSKELSGPGPGGFSGPNASLQIRKSQERRGPPGL